MLAALHHFWREYALGTVEGGEYLGQPHHVTTDARCPLDQIHLVSPVGYIQGRMNPRDPAADDQCLLYNRHCRGRPGFPPGKAAHNLFQVPPRQEQRLLFSPDVATVLLSKERGNGNLTAAEPQREKGILYDLLVHCRKTAHNDCTLKMMFADGIFNHLQTRP